MDKAQEWREKSRVMTAAEDGVIVDLTLPSGMVIRARRPTPGFIAGIGRLPLSLASAADGGVRDTKAASAEDTAAFFDFLRELLLYCVVEPEIALKPGPGQIHPREIAEKDVTFIFHWAMRGSEAGRLESFRAKPAHGRGGDDGAAVPPASVRVARPARSAGRTQLRPRGEPRRKSTR